MAGHLLDANSEARLAGLPEETAANLRANIADAVALLPKLATGLDVNPRFTDVRAFEFTQDVAIFDLLDTRLVHGWLVDPQARLLPTIRPLWQLAQQLTLPFYTRNWLAMRVTTLASSHLSICEHQAEQRCCSSRRVGSPVQFI